MLGGAAHAVREHLAIGYVDGVALVGTVHGLPVEDHRRAAGRGDRIGDGETEA